MNPLYRPLPNRLVRTLLKPLAPWIPDGRLLPVHGPIRVRLPDGAAILMACNPTSMLAKVLFWRGFEGFEPDMARIFLPLARRASVFVDVGANIGYYSLAAAAVNPALRIFSFEPLPAAFRYLEQSIALNDFRNIEPERIALSDRAGTVTFYAARRTRYEAIADHLVSTGGFDAEQAAKAGPTTAFEVETQPLDHYAAEVIGQRVDLIKLDTEATEHIVLAGAERVLAEDRPVVLCEVLPGRIEAALEAIFRRHDYALFEVGRAGLGRVERLAPEGVEGKDHVMIPAEAAEEVQALVRRERERV